MIPLINLSLQLLLAATSNGTLVFEENRGQAPADVRYAARAAGQTVALHNLGLRIIQNEAIVELSFPGSRTDAPWEEREPVGGQVSYFVGNDPSRWVKHARQFRRIVRRDVYPGIDLLFYGAGRQFEYDILVHPGADASRIRLRVSGAQANVTAAGDIEIAAGGEHIRQRLPAIYQLRGDGERMNVAGRFLSRPDGDFALELGAFEPDLALWIDPVLENTSYLGGEADDRIVATGGNWFAGTTSSILFPRSSRQGRQSRDIFITFINTGGPIPFETLIFGGSGDDELTAALTLSRGSSFATEAWLVGHTDSQDLPFASPANAFQGGQRDGFWLRIPNNTNPLTGAYLGGAGDDRIHAAALNGTNLLVAGSTDSAGLSTGRFQQTELAGGRDAFLASYLSNTLSRFIYLGGSGDDQALGLLHGQGGRVYVAGETRSADFPGGGVLRGPSDGFLARIDDFNPVAETHILAISSLIGGGAEDRVDSLAAQPKLRTSAEAVPSLAYNEEIALAGTTTSDDFPITTEGGRPGGGSDAFVQRIDPVSGSVRFSARIGGSGDEDGRAVSLEANDALVLAGTTNSTDLPVVDAVQPRSGGGKDGYFALWDSSNTIRQLSYYGGEGDEQVLTLAWLGRDYRIAGVTTSTNLTARQGLQAEFAGAEDGFWADIGTNFLIVPSRLDVGKDLTVALEIGIGQKGKPAVTVRSSDPARLRVAGSATRTILDLRTTFLLEGLASEGEVELTISAPGFGSRVVPVRLHPTSLLVSLGSTGFPSASPVRLGPPGTDAQVNISFGVVNRERNEITFGTLREGVSRPRIDFTSSDPSVVEVGPIEPNRNFNENGLPARLLRLRGGGMAEIRGVSPEYPVWPEGLRLIVDLPTVNPLRDPIELSRDLQIPYNLSAILAGRGILSINAPITVRSDNPGLVVVSLSGALPGGESVSLPPGAFLNTLPIFVQAIGSAGETSLLVSSPLLSGEARIPVRVGPARLIIGNSTAGPLTLQPNDSPVRLGIFLQPVGLSPLLSPNYTLRPGAAIPRREIRSSDARVATVSYGMNRFAFLGRDSGIPMLFREAGEATLSVTLSSPAFTLTGERRVQVTAVPSVPLTLTPLPAVEVGDGLQARIGIDLPVGVTGTLRVLNPALASLVSGTAPPAAQIPLTTSGTVAIYGLSSSGSTTLRLELSNGQRTESTITLLPSTVVVNAFQTLITFPSQFNTGLAAGWYTLDGRTGLPLNVQLPQPGKTATVQLRASGNSIQFDSLSFTLTSTNINSNSGFAVIPFRARSIGVTLVDWDLPAGLPTPAQKATLRIEVVPPPIQS